MFLYIYISRCGYIFIKGSFWASSTWPRVIHVLIQSYNSFGEGGDPRLRFYAGWGGWPSGAWLSLSEGMSRARAALYLASLAKLKSLWCRMAEPYSWRNCWTKLGCHSQLTIVDLCSPRRASRWQKESSLAYAKLGRAPCCPYGSEWRGGLWERQAFPSAVLRVAQLGPTCAIGRSACRCQSFMASMDR